MLVAQLWAGIVGRSVMGTGCWLLSYEQGLLVVQLCVGVICSSMMSRVCYSLGDEHVIQIMVCKVIVGKVDV